MKKYLNFLSASLVLILGISLSVWVQKQRTEEQQTNANNTVSKIITNQEKSIENQILASFSSIEILQWLTYNKDSISRNEFENYTTPLLRGNPGIKAISWVPKIDYNDRLNFERSLYKEFNKKIQITWRNEKNENVITQKADFYFPVKFIEPFNKNIAALGYDIYSNQIRKRTIDEVIETGKIQITQQIKLVQDSVGYGFLCLIPVFNNSENHPKNIKGLISAVFKVEEIIKQGLYLTQNENINLVIFDLTDQNSELLYGNTDLLEQNFPVEKKVIYVANRKWQLNFFINPEYLKGSVSYWYLYMGMALSVLVALLLLVPLTKLSQNRKLTQNLLAEKIEREQAEDNLKESEDKFKEAFYISPDAVKIIRLSDGTYLDVNKGFEEVFGYSGEEIIGKTSLEFNIWKNAEDRKKLVDGILEKGSVINMEAEFLTKKGKIITGLISARIIEINHEKAILSITRDITERKKEENSIKESNIKWQTTFDGIKDSIMLLDANGVILQMNSITRDFFNVTEADAIGKHCHDVVHQKNCHIEGCPQLKLKKSLQREFMQLEFGDKIFEIVVDPILNEKNKLTGMVHIVSDITERKKIEIKIRESEEHFRTIFEQSASGMILISLQGKLLNVNAPYCEMLNYSAAELKGKHIDDITLPEDREIGNDIIKKMLGGKIQKATFEKRYLKRTGEIIWVKINSALLSDESGNPKYFISQIEDITQRMVADKLILASENKFKALVEQSLTGIYIFEKENFIYVNNRFCEIFGYSEEEIMAGMKPTDVISIEDRERANENVKKRLLGEVQSVHYVAKGNYKTGKPLWVEIHGTHLEMEGKAVITGTVLDITERKLAEEKLNTANEQLNRFMDSVPDSFVILDSDLNFLDVNETGLTWWNKKKKDVIGKNITELIPNTKESGRYDIYKKIIKTGEPYFSEEVVIYGIDEKSFSLRAFKVGSGVGIITTDITDQRKAEKELRESEDRFRTIFEHSASGLCLTGLNGKLLKVNNPLCEMLGYSADELEGKHFNDITYPEDLNIGIENVKQMIAGKTKKAVFEKRYVKKSGEPVWVHINSTLFIDSKGNHIFFITQMEDISKRIEAENALKLSEEKFEKSFRLSPYMVSLSSMDGLVIEVNDSVFDTLGYTRDEFLGNNTTVLPIWVDLNERAEFVNRLKQNGTLHEQEVKYRKKSGEIRDYLLSADIIELNKSKVLLSIIRDITEQKKVKEKIIKMNEELEQKVMERTQELETKIAEIQRINKLFIGRELRMKELKDNIKVLEEKLKKE